MTVLVGGMVTGSFDACPLCGQKLRPPRAEDLRLRLQKGSDPRQDLAEAIQAEKKHQEKNMHEVQVSSPEEPPGGGAL
jgi:DNA repair exonuclease SbcCD ATPase subunit